MPKTTIGERLKEARGSISQAEITRKYGLGKNTLSNYETGVTAPKMDFLISFIKDFGLDANWLLFGVEEAPRPELSSVEAALLDNFRHCPAEEQDAIVRTSALLAKPQAKKVKKTG